MMPRTFRLLLLILGAALLIPVAHAQANDNDGCSDLTLRGDYAFRISGEIFALGPPPAVVNLYRDGVAMTHFDGRGTLKQVDFMMGSGKVPSDPTQPSHTAIGDIDPVTGFSINETGKYHVNSDCTGSGEIDLPTAVNASDDPITPNGKIDLVFVISNGGRTIHTIVTSLTLPGGAKALANIHSDAERLSLF
ncbi:MAG: hypothetical protein ACRD4X_07535 [Candidatus Acidiferrales bacterium]